MDERDERLEGKGEHHKIPLRKEVVEVKKERVVVEEIVIKRKQVTKTVQVEVPVKREELVIQRRKLTKGAHGEEVWETESEEVIPISEENGHLSNERIDSGDKVSDTPHIGGQLDQERNVDLRPGSQNSPF